LVGRIAAAAGTAKQTRAMREIVRASAGSAGPADAWWRAATLEGLSNGVRGGSKPGSDLDPERTLVAALIFGTEPPPVRHAALQLLEATGLAGGTASDPILHRAEQLIGDQRADAGVRGDAVRVLALKDVKAYAPLLRGLLERTEPASVQVAAVRALAAQKGPDVAATFIQLWPAWTPAVRAEAVRALVGEPGRIRLLLDAVAGGRINATEIDRTLRIRMMMVDDDTLRARARTLFPESAAAGEGGSRESRAAVIARYQPATNLAGDPERGRQVFGRICSACHQYRGAHGAAFGPDLGEVRNRLPGALLVDILDPNRAIADRFALWNVELTDGSTTGGIITDETADAVTLHLPGGSETTVPRARIKSMRVSTVSAMPEGLEGQIDVQQMADLIAFIRGKT
jgi:putative heme-binding domain-containing protein